jgi:ATP-dependent RNA helicase DDX24/MAK5
LPLAEPLYRALAELKFEKPTEIQERALSMEIGAQPLPPRTDDTEEANEDEGDEWTGIEDAATVDNEQAAEDVSAEPYISPFEPEPEAGPVTSDRDIIGVAQTGSGKTLAYGLPILSYILNNPPNSSIQDATRLSALILAPTRELALQVRAAISEVSIRTNALLPEEQQDPHKNAPRKRVRGQHISVVALTGGMSVEKQKRQLSRGADILVATPGRLWDLIGEVGPLNERDRIEKFERADSLLMCHVQDDQLAKAIKGVKFLVIDEADRMIENGHFAELENIVKLTRRKGYVPWAFLRDTRAMR